jgi:hypothetical protein
LVWIKKRCNPVVRILPCSVSIYPAGQVEKYSQDAIGSGFPNEAMPFYGALTMRVFDGTDLLSYFTDMDTMKLSVLLQHGRALNAKFLNPTYLCK